MRRAFGLALTLLVAAGVLAAVRPSRLAFQAARGEPAPSELFISGLHVAGASPTAFVHVTNASKRPADFYTLRYSLFHVDGNRAAAPVELLDLLLPGHSVTIDVAAVVDAYRQSVGVSSFTGPVQMVALGSSCVDAELCPPGAVPRPFGPEVIHVEAVQTEGAATYDAVVHWRGGDR